MERFGGGRGTRDRFLDVVGRLGRGDVSARPGRGTGTGER